MTSKNDDITSRLANSNNEKIRVRDEDSSEWIGEVKNVRVLEDTVVTTVYVKNDYIDSIPHGGIKYQVSIVAEDDGVVVRYVSDSIVEKEIKELEVME